MRCAERLDMRIKRIEELIAWQQARELERRVFAFTNRPPANRDRDFCDQIRRSASSAPRNIAEGFGRFWPGEFAHKLHIAVGELHASQDHLEKALEQKYVNDDDELEMFGMADRAIGAAVKFIEYLEAAGPDWKKQFLLRRREAYRARQRAGTIDPNEKSELKESDHRSRTRSDIPTRSRDATTGVSLPGEPRIGNANRRRPSNKREPQPKPDLNQNQHSNADQNPNAKLEPDANPNPNPNPNENPNRTRT
jgi:four helix bundle protein